MDPEQPTPRQPAHAHSPLTASGPDQGRQAASNESREELPSGAFPGLVTPPVGPSEELATTVHQAISQRDMDMLRKQVRCYGRAALEVRNEKEMTPLYHAVLSSWTEAAWFLLHSGAEVSNSEQTHFNLFADPFMRLVVKTEDTKLLAEVIKRGANIRARDYRGSYCVDLDKIRSQKARDALFDCLAETVADEGQRRPDLLKDLLFVVRAGAESHVNRGKIEEFITRPGGCHQAEMFQVLAACCCCESFCDCKLALRYWRKTAECTKHQSESQTFEEDLACGSIFADILDVKVHPLPNTVTTGADIQAMKMRALLTFEKLLPEIDFLMKVSFERKLSHLQMNYRPNVIAVLCRLTTIRALYWTEVDKVMNELCMELGFCTYKGAFHSPGFLDAMKTIKNCLTSLKSMHPEAYQSSPSDHGERWKDIFILPFSALLNVMVFFYGDEVAATPENMQIFRSHVKDCMQGFPWAHCSSFLHFLASVHLSFWAFENVDATIPASIIKILVTCSAEAFGRIRQNSPSHLVSNKDGDTPLHYMASLRSREELMQGGLLQCFLDHGAHLCTRNNKGETVRSILVKRGVCTEGGLLPSL